MQLFYNSEINNNTKNFSFSKEESLHLSKVLRKKSGDIIQITNGLGWLFQAEITNNHSKNSTAIIVSAEYFEPKSYSIHLAVAPTKMNDRFEWFLEKATEIGVSSITPVICDNSERRIVKTERFEKILIAAMKQSLQFHLPVLNPVCQLSDFLTNSSSHQQFIAHCEPTQKQSLKSVYNVGKDATVLIGPEGDFSVKEIEMALNNDYIPISLGSTRLRTETAAVVACHTLVLMNDD
ncbi:16S rRNA (uracil(1498)-N(3))-methyltransferase [Paucihalobacter ruber]|uniref:Ribosomal RNA small subunit methyltransferase E n=1 Tax=Paucihalobacter ruber TaxID=2567861 RepID=A0A506PK62_9FLAO|nr:16S rRNA (uracil(1498)-N(3))-methyltransferase [Paucihalobacter ruber]TPV33482.1 16S rRNA (uracil(1498)-N(3))-methyltransferase [Paucihalobacter ruber]